MELNYVNKNIKPTLQNPTKQGKQVDTYFKKQMKPTGMVIKEDQLLNEKEQSLKKKIFKLDKMETLVHTDEFLSTKFNELKQNADELYGYHWNETILNMLFNDYVLNSPKYLDKYKNTRAKSKTRRGEEGIAQLQKDIDKEKEVTTSAEKRKQDLMKKSETNDDENVDEGIFSRGVEVNLPVNKLSKNDTYFVDVTKKKLLAHIPYGINPEDKQAIITKYSGNPNYKQLSWFDAVSRGVKGVPKAVSDGSYDQMKAEFDKKYAKQGGIEAIPALTEDIQIGKKYKISDGSGLDSNKVVTVVNPKMVKTDGSGVPLNVSGAYKPVDWKKEVAIQYDNGEIGTMFKSRLQPIENAMEETTGAVSAGAYSTGLDAQNMDKTYQNETTTSASSGQYSGKAIWSKNAKPAANKPAWKGGQIIGESVINGDLDYLTNPAAFKKYILKNEIISLLNEEVMFDESENFKQHAERMYAKLLQYSHETPELKNDENFKSTLEIWKKRAESGVVEPEINQEKQVSEHHIKSKEEMIDFILQNTYDDSKDIAKYSKDQLNSMNDDEIKSIYDSTEKEMGITEQPEGDASNKTEDGLFRGKWNTNENEEKSDVYYEIEARLRPTDSSLDMSELQDISNEYNVEFEDVLYTMNDVLNDRDNANAEEAKGIVYDALKELGHDHDNTVTFEELMNYINSNYSTDEINKNQLEIAYKKLTTDPNQLSLFEINFKENYGGDPEVGENEYEDSQELNAIIGKEHQEYKDAIIRELIRLDSGEKLINHIKNLESNKPVGYNFSEYIIRNKNRGFSPEKTAGHIRDYWYGVSESEMIFEKALSKAQQQFMGMVHSYHKGDLENPSPAVKKAADSISDKDAKDFASTKHKGLPDHVDEGMNVEYFKDMQGEPPFTIGGKTFKYVWAKYPNGNIDIGVYDTSRDMVYDYDSFRKENGLDESMIDDQPDSIINPQQNSIATSMDSDELNKDGLPIAGAAIGGVQENDEPSYYKTLSDDPQIAIDAQKFREKLKNEFGVDSVDQLSNVERARLMKSMNFDDDQPEEIEPSKFTDDQRAEYKGRDEKRLAYLAQNANQINDLNDYNKIASLFKRETGENLHHPMAILASIQALPQGSELRNKLTNIENILKSNMKESVNEERKNSAILNVEKLGKENAKNFNSDKAKEDALSQEKTYPKDDGIHKAPVYPNPKDFYIEQDLEKVQKDAKSMADIEKEALAKTKDALENKGDSTADGEHIPKRNLTKEEGYALAMNRGDGMQDIVYDNKPSDKFEKRMEQDMGSEVYKARQDKMDYKKDAPMYNKDTQPTENGDKKEQDNKFAKGYNNESVTGKYRDEFNKIKLVEFKLGDVTIVESVDENATKISLDGMGNKYSFVGKKINENTDVKKIVDEYQFYLTENGYVAIRVDNNQMIVENKFDKMKHLMNYNPNNYVDTKKSVKF